MAKLLIGKPSVLSRLYDDNGVLKYRDGTIEGAIPDNPIIETDDHVVNSGGSGVSGSNKLKIIKENYKNLGPIKSHIYRESDTHMSLMYINSSKYYVLLNGEYVSLSDAISNNNGDAFYNTMESWLDKNLIYEKVENTFYYENKVPFIPVGEELPDTSVVYQPIEYSMSQLTSTEFQDAHLYFIRSAPLSGGEYFKVKHIMVGEEDALSEMVEAYGTDQLEEMEIPEMPGYITYYLGSPEMQLAAYFTQDMITAMGLPIEPGVYIAAADQMFEEITDMTLEINKGSATNPIYYIPEQYQIDKSAFIIPALVSYSKTTSDQSINYNITNYTTPIKAKEIAKAIEDNRELVLMLKEMNSSEYGNRMIFLNNYSIIGNDPYSIYFFSTTDGNFDKQFTKIDKGSMTLEDFKAGVYFSQYGSIRENNEFSEDLYMVELKEKNVFNYFTALLVADPDTNKVIITIKTNKLYNPLIIESNSTKSTSDYYTMVDPEGNTIYNVVKNFKYTDLYNVINNKQPIILKFDYQQIFSDYYYFYNQGRYNLIFEKDFYYKNDVNNSEQGGATEFTSFTEATVNNETDFGKNIFYYKENSSYYIATEYDSSKTYYYIKLAPPNKKVHYRIVLTWTSVKDSNIDDSEPYLIVSKTYETLS